MWCLGRFLPLIIGNLVPPDDERWQLFNMLLDINDIVFSQVVNEDSIGVLEGLIEEHHATFIGLYPGRSVIPKMHYMIHFPSQMLRSVSYKLQKLSKYCSGNRVHAMRMHNMHENAFTVTVGLSSHTLQTWGSVT